MDFNKLLKLDVNVTFYNYFKDYIQNFAIVGGAIRNYVIGLKVSDIDIATTYKPEELAQICQKENIKYIETGIKYGTITIIIKNYKYEVTSLRSDIKTDGRHTQVKYCKNYELDSKRRDFTINALYLDFSGILHDYHNGLEDIYNKSLRFIGNPATRIKEDYLRIIRLLRFYSQLQNFNIDNNSLNSAIKEKEYIYKLSPHRIHSEFFKLIRGKNYINSLNLIRKNNILDKYLYIEKQKLNILANHNINSPYSILAYILQTENNIEKFNKIIFFSNKENKMLKAIIKSDLNIINGLTDTDIKKGLFYYDQTTFLNIIEYSILKTNFSPKNHDLLIRRIMKAKAPTLPIDGNDILKFNYKNSEIGAYKKYLTKLWIEHDFKLTKEELLKFIK